jgi:D-sedoheptulose 7-phosphate isomerase
VRDAILRKARESADVKIQFFQENAENLERCVRDLAARFSAGGRLLAMGNGGSACDAEHVAVEFQHPIIEKRRPLPALALCVGSATLTAIGNDTDFSRIFEDQLELLARPEDALLGISTSGASPNVNRALKRAREMGLLTVGFTGRDGGRMPEVCDYCFTVKSWSIHRVQETHTALLHLLWDQVHVALGEDDVL